VAEEDDIDALAGEYVLGTLAGDERRAAEARIVADPDFRAAVARWETRLQPLADAVPPVTPHAATFDRILGRLDSATAPAGENVIKLRRSLRRWRTTTAIVGAAAAVLFGVVVLDRSIVRAPSEFVAVLTAEGAKPAFVATVDLVRGTLAIRRVGAEPPGDKSYELWAVEPNVPAPRSLGLVDNVNYTRHLDVPAEGLVLAISLEPKGGSPTGVATGPIVFTGPLVPTE
jgi:anti-sigma-K factor RskA